MALTLSPGGGVSGTPKTPGTFSFSAVATDSEGASGSGGFTIIILAAPLNITGGPGGSVPVGTPISITFGGTGGVPPYRFTPGGGLPPGMSFAKDTLSGTPTTAGTFSFNITLADSAGGVVTKGFSLVVVPPGTPAITVGGTVGDGKVGVPYVGQLRPPAARALTHFPVQDCLTVSRSRRAERSPALPPLQASSPSRSGHRFQGDFGKQRFRHYDRPGRRENRDRLTCPMVWWIPVTRRRSPLRAESRPTVGR